MGGGRRRGGRVGGVLVVCPFLFAPPPLLVHEPYSRNTKSIDDYCQPMKLFRARVVHAAVLVVHYRGRIIGYDGGGVRKSKNMRELAYILYNVSQVY